MLLDFKLTWKTSRRISGLSTLWSFHSSGQFSNTCRVISVTDDWKLRWTHCKVIKKETYLWGDCEFMTFRWVHQDQRKIYNIGVIFVVFWKHFLEDRRVIWDITWRRWSVIWWHRRFWLSNFCFGNDGYWLVSFFLILRIAYFLRRNRVLLIHDTDFNFKQWQPDFFLKNS